MKNLFDGHARFQSDYWRRHQPVYAELAAAGQKPAAMVIGCADSRVAPELIFDVAPGEIFVVRNIGNLVAPYAPDAGRDGTAAALEYAVNVLGVQTIAVLGHSQCGGIRALMEGPAPRHGEFIDGWLAPAGAARARVCDAAAPADFDRRCALCERESIRVSLGNLLTFPFIRPRVDAGALALAGLHFDVRTGMLERVN